jgi:iron-sulfur cluster assembly protein
MAMVTLQTEAEIKAAQAAVAASEKKDPLAGMNVLTAQGQEPDRRASRLPRRR